MSKKLPEPLMAKVSPVTVPLNVPDKMLAVVLPSYVLWAAVMLSRLTVFFATATFSC